MNAEVSTDRKKYLSIMGAWALSFGCSVGWGSFVMPGTTFLPIAGPIGTAIGLGLGGLVMLILAANFNYLMNRFPDGGGIYTYTKKAFGYDHGFLSAWFLIITYIAIIWANATALPLIARTVLGDTFRFGYLYKIAGFESITHSAAEAKSSFLSNISHEIRTPVMDGLTAAKNIRSLDRPDAKVIPIIAMTANVFDEDVERSLEAGMNAHLFKPIEPDRLYETMARLIMEKETL